jgi:hypothetical protein
MPRKPVRPLAAAAVFALLVLLTVAAFAYSQQQKRDPLVLDRVTLGVDGKNNFTPNGDCRFDHIRIRFRTTQSDQGTVQIIRPSGARVLTLARDEFLKRYKFHTFFWDGRWYRGGIAPPGRYKVRVQLLGQDRTLVPPGSIRLDRTPAKGSSACDAGGPGGLSSGAAEPAR